MNPSMQLYGEVVRAHRSSLVFTVHNVGETAAPLAHGMDALHVCDVGQHFGQPQIPLSPMREVW